MVLFLRALTRDLNVSTPGKGVGVTSQCLTGGFALATVFRKPSLPIPLPTASRSDLEWSPSDLIVVSDRCANEEIGRAHV